MPAVLQVSFIVKPKSQEPKQAGNKKGVNNMAANCIQCHLIGRFIKFSYKGRFGNDAVRYFQGKEFSHIRLEFVMQYIHCNGFHNNEVKGKISLTDGAEKIL